MATLAGFLGALALLLSAIGIYGLMSYIVTRRTGEIGVRMALGAEAGSIILLILRESMVLVLAGVTVGLPAALAASRLVSGMLFGLTPHDASTLGISAAVLLAVALTAAYFPARRA